jgi:hypothetical protein
VIKEKIKIEADCRRELMEITKNIYDSKLEKTQIQKIGIELYNELSEARLEYMVYKYIKIYKLILYNILEQKRCSRSRKNENR